jgi:hypothetical protein
MINIYLAHDLDNPVRQFNTVYEYAKHERDARVNTSLAGSIKAIASAAYICLHGRKHHRKTYSALFGAHIQIRKADVVVES